MNEQRTSHRKFDAQLRQPTEAGKRADRLWFLVGALGAAWITVLIGMQSFPSGAGGRYCCSCRCGR